MLISYYHHNDKESINSVVLIDKRINKVYMIHMPSVNKTYQGKAFFICYNLHRR